MMTYARSLRSGRDKDLRFELAEQDKLVPNFARRGDHPASIAEGSQDLRARLASGTPGGAALPAAPQGELPLKTTGSRRAGVFSRLSVGRWQLGNSDSKPVLKADSKGQLSLHLVKVVRNDLSDSDLELVPARVPKIDAAPPAEKKPLPATASEQEIEPETSRWSRFASRFLKVGSVE